MAGPISPDILECRALIIDGNPTSRSVLAGMLRDMGMTNVVQTSRIVDGRRMLETREFDVVLSDYHFDHSPITGQDLLDELRRSQLLPYSTVFIMVTAEASYAMVAEVAEAALDSYLLKPHTSSALKERIDQARHRKRVLKEIFTAIEADEFERAAGLCLDRFSRRDEYWLYAARIGAEIYLRLGRHQPAKALYEAVVAAKAAPWAKLGVARAQLGEGHLPQAKRTLESLIAEEPTYADAYDVMGRVQVEQGDLGSALDTFRNATNITPHSLTRLQKQGMLAFFMGEQTEALQSLERAVRVGISSKMFDCETLVMLCMIHFDKKDSKSLQRNYANLSQMVERIPESKRLKSFMCLANVFKMLHERQVGESIRHLKILASEIKEDHFDFEAATNFMAVLARLRMNEIHLEENSMWIYTVALRFCVSKTAAEMLSLALQRHEPDTALVHEAQQRVAALAEQAMTHSVTGSPAAAVKTLMTRGRETLNAKLIELSSLVLQRHAAKIPDAGELAGAIEQLKIRYCTKGTQVGLGNANAGGRSAGSLNLRSPSQAAAAV